MAWSLHPNMGVLYVPSRFLDISTGVQMCAHAQAGALAGHVQHAAVSLFGTLLAQLQGMEATRHERYLGTMPWLRTRIIVPWRPLKLLLVPPPKPLLPQHVVWGARGVLLTQSC